MQTVVTQLSLGWIGFTRTAAGLWALTLPQTDRREVWLRLAARGAFEALSSPDRLLIEQLESYFRGEEPDFEGINLDWSGYSTFQRTVLGLVRSVPYGRTCSYGELARAVGSPQAARAVGNALAANRTPLVVPCHRIVRVGGMPGGYSAGPGWKERLLRLEGGSGLYMG